MPPAGRVHSGAEDFETLVVAALARYLRQRGHPVPSDPEARAIGRRLRELIRQKGLPRPLRPGEAGTPGGMPAAECAAGAARILGGETTPALAEAAQQLVKACFHPEFTQCRDSYREAGGDGVCRRQEIDRARVRLSGAHCVDCPHWTALAPAAHFQLLAAAWRGSPDDLTANRGIFLPEDFRALRRWLHAAARKPVSPP
jgi:hypothetical protein